MQTAMRNTYLLVSALCAVATVVLAAVQTFNLSGGSHTGQPESRPAPAAVPAAPPAMTVSKIDGSPQLSEIAPASLSFSPGTLDAVAQTYPLADIFDGDSATVLRSAEAGGELDFIVQLKSGQSARLAAIEYRHPAGASAESVPTHIDLTVLPDGELDGGGREVQSFRLAPDRSTQLFRFPPSRGRGLWVRFAGPASPSGMAIGDIRLLADAN
jgi:hypothetical protein